MEAIQTLISNEIPSKQSSPLNSRMEEREVDETSESVEELTGETPSRRKPLRFDPEPTQRMVVVRRRSKKKRRKVTPGERFINGLRIVTLAFSALYLILRITNHQDVLTQWKQSLSSALHPVRSHLHAPDTDAIALILVILILLYTMPGVSRKVNRLIGLSDEK